MLKVLGHSDQCYIVNAHIIGTPLQLVHYLILGIFHMRIFVRCQCYLWFFQCFSVMVAVYLSRALSSTGSLGISIVSLIVGSVVAVYGILLVRMVLMTYSRLRGSNAGSPNSNTKRSAMRMCACVTFRLNCDAFVKKR